MKKIGFMFLQLLVAVMGCASFLWGAYLIGMGIGDVFWGLLFCYIFIFLSFCLIFTLHELGHAFFGYLTGYEMVAFGVGKYLLVHKNGKWHIERTLLLKGMAAQYIGIKKDEQDQRFLLMWAGGLIVHLVLCLVSLLLGFLTKQWGPAIIWIGENLSLFILNAIPHGMTDGARIWELWQSPSHIPFMYQQLRHGAQTVIAPDEADLVDFQLPFSEDTGGIVDICNLNYIETLIFDGRLEEAESLLEVFVEKVDNSFSLQMGTLCLLEVYLLLDKLDQAERLAQKKGVLSLFSMKLANIQAIHALYQLKVKKNKKRALKAVELGEKNIPYSRMLRDEKAFYRELLDDVRRQSVLSQAED